jgi:hypothetical protein
MTCMLVLYQYAIQIELAFIPTMKQMGITSFSDRVGFENIRFPLCINNTIFSHTFAPIKY